MVVVQTRGRRVGDRALKLLFRDLIWDSEAEQETALELLDSFEDGNGPEFLSDVVLLNGFTVPMKYYSWCSGVAPLLPLLKGLVHDGGDLVDPLGEWHPTDGVPLGVYKSGKVRFAIGADGEMESVGVVREIVTSDTDDVMLKVEVQGHLATACTVPGPGSTDGYRTAFTRGGDV